ncbi:MAG: flagellar brake protein [Lachnospirales bacterium]
MENVIQVGSSIELSLVKEGQVLRSYKSKIESPDDPNAILAQIPSIRGQLIKLPKSSSYEMIVFADEKLVKFKVQLVGYTKQEGFMYCVLKLLSKGEKVQRREYFRYNKQIPFTYFMKNKESDDFNMWEIKPGLIKDIGGGGIRFVANQTINEGDEIKVTIPLNDQFFVSKCKILFTDPTPEGSAYKYQYRSQFKDVYESEREVIVQYNLSEQRKSISKRNS